MPKSGRYCLEAAIAVFFVAAAALLPSPAVAFGALAVGEPSDTVRDGIALGWSFELDSKEEAEATALEACRAGDSPAATRRLCKIIARFKGECVALSIDPRPGRDGFGWSVMAKKSDAERAALRQCRATASKGSRCQVKSDCD